MSSIEAQTAVCAGGSSRIHVSIATTIFGQLDPLCQGVAPWMVYKTDQPVNCRKCLTALKELERIA